MQEILLKANRRILLIALIPLIALGVIAGWLVHSILHISEPESISLGFAIPIGIVVLLIVTIVITFASMALRPRVTYQNGFLLIAVNAARATKVPLDIVECFFMGESETNFQNKKYKNARTQTVVVRLAEKEHDWKQRETLGILARWCDGYITLRGTWTEPLCIELVNRMNHQLAEIKRQHKADLIKGTK